MISVISFDTRPLIVILVACLCLIIFLGIIFRKLTREKSISFDFTQVEYFINNIIKQAISVNAFNDYLICDNLRIEFINQKLTIDGDVLINSKYLKDIKMISDSNGSLIKICYVVCGKKACESLVYEGLYFVS